MRSLVLLVPLAGAALSGAAPIHAQTAVQTTGPEEQRTPGWVFTPMLRFGGTWDDNVLLLFPEETTPRDYGSPIGPGLSLDYTGRRTQFSGGYDGSFILYRTLGELNSSHQTARARFEHRATRRLLIFGSETFISAPTTDVFQLGVIPFYRVGSRSNSVGGGVEAALTKHTTLRGAYSLHSMEFDFDERAGIELRGGHAHQFDLAYNQAISPRVSLGAEYTMQRAYVAGQPNLPEFPEDRFSIHGGAATVSYLLQPGLTLSGGVGVARLLASLTQEARTGPTFRVGISQRDQRFELSGSYQRSFVPSFGFGGTFQNEEWSARARLPFARNRAYVDGGFSWLINDALGPSQSSLRSRYLVGTVGYRATRWLSVEGFFSRTQQRTELAGRGELTRNQVGFQVVTAKPFNIR